MFYKLGKYIRVCLLRDTLLWFFENGSVLRIVVKGELRYSQIRSDMMYSDYCHRIRKKVFMRDLHRVYITDNLNMYHKRPLSNYHRHHSLLLNRATQTLKNKHT